MLVMAWFKKKPDPISDRARALNEEIAQLEARIKQLDTNIQKESQPRLRPAALPRSAEKVPAAPPNPPPPPAPSAPREIFEELHGGRLETGSSGQRDTELYNELGVRKYDLPGLFRRMRSHFRGPAATNPKLVNYLAAGGIQGLRPLRYEKRVARNRFIFLVIFLFLLLLGIITVFVKNN